MSKRNKIIYWVTTVWLGLGMLSTGIVQLLRSKEEAALFAQLGYPHYLLILLGVLKILGVIVIVLPKFPVLKEWAYAGFFFAMAGAIFSHVAVGRTTGIFSTLLLLALTLLSWHFRPAERKVSPINTGI
jgi:uncharacterized membrane protein YphA (DoxX/SURF4 family)